MPVDAEPTLLSEWVPVALADAFGRERFDLPDDGVHRVMFDSMIYDDLLREDAMLDGLKRAVAAGMIEILVTHVQVDELTKTAARDRERAKLLIHTLLQRRCPPGCVTPRYGS